MSEANTAFSGRSERAKRATEARLGEESEGTRSEATLAAAERSEAPADTERARAPERTKPTPREGTQEERPSVSEGGGGGNGGRAAGGAPRKNNTRAKRAPSASRRPRLYDIGFWEDCGNICARCGAMGLDAPSAAPRAERE
jgi:hypothetical protein